MLHALLEQKNDGKMMGDNNQLKWVKAFHRTSDMKIDFLGFYYFVKTLNLGLWGLNVKVQSVNNIDI